MPDVQPHRRNTEKGTRWTHPGKRGVWTIATVGPKYVTLSPSVPVVGAVRVDRVMWPGAWEPES